MVASLPYGLFGWCGRSKKGKELKYHCSVLIFQLSVSLVMVVLALRHLSDTFGNPSAYLKAAASPLHSSSAFFWIGLTTDCLGDQKKSGPEHPTSI